MRPLSLSLRVCVRGDEADRDARARSSNWVGSTADLTRYRYGLGSNDEARRVDWWTDHTMIERCVRSSLLQSCALVADSPSSPARSFKLIIDFLTNRVNSINGRRYGDDPTILAWETGNEMNHLGMRPAPASWTLTVAKHLKSRAPRTLVMDGSFARNDDPERCYPNEVLDSPDVDIVSYHYYGDGDARRVKKDCEVARRHNKVCVPSLLSLQHARASLTLEDGRSQVRRGRVWLLQQGEPVRVVHEGPRLGRRCVPSLSLLVLSLCRNPRLTRKDSLQVPARSSGPCARTRLAAGTRRTARATASGPTVRSLSLSLPLPLPLSHLIADALHRPRADIPGWKDPAHHEFDAREASIVPYIRAASFKINGLRVPSAHPVPPAPSRPWLVQTRNGAPAVAFKGAAWAHSYVVVVRGPGGEHEKAVKDHTKEGELAVELAREVQAAGAQGVSVSVRGVSVDGMQGAESEALSL